jgi:DNA-binding CsgD family transcriptional regulator
MGCRRFDKLTEGQRECLRLVLAHKSSKEIARLLGKSRFTIDKRIERALRTLGVESRTEAALLLAGHERALGYERLVCEPQTLAAPDQPDIMTSSQSGEMPDGGYVRDSVIVTDPMLDDWLGRRRRRLFRGPLPATGGKRNDLTTIERLIWIAVGALAIIIGLFVTLAVAESLQRTLWGLASRSN